MFPTLPVDQRIGIFLSASENNERIVFLPVIGKTIVFITTIPLLLYVLFFFQRILNDYQNK